MRGGQSSSSDNDVLFSLEGLIGEKDLPMEEDDNDRNLNYNPPAQKTLQEIQELDKDDESLVKYKQTLLGPEALMAGEFT